MISKTTINNPKKKIILYSSVLIFTLTHLYRELHLGNINLLITVLLLASFYLFQIKERKTLSRNKWSSNEILAAILYSMVVLFKPHFLILLPLLLFRRKYVMLEFSFIFILSGLFLPALLLGFNENNNLLAQWLITMKTHNEAILTSHHTISALLCNIVPSLHSVKPLFLAIPIIISSALLFLGFYLYNKKQEKFNPTVNTSNFYLEYIVLLALIPNLTVTDTEHFLYSLPLLIWIIERLLTTGINSKFVLGTLILGLLLYGGNWTDLIGRNTSTLIDNWGFLGIGNLIIISVGIWLNMTQKPKITR